ncbi:MAG TPA: preQ(1) synthase [Planctomycetota bacterium]
MAPRTQPRLETFANPAPGRDYEIRLEAPEFTCLCPKTGQPDFAVLRIRYVPDQRCVELKSLKLYLWSFRDQGHFHEAVTNQILDELVGLLAPRRMTLEAEFNVRGGIRTVVVASHPQAGVEEPRQARGTSSESRRGRARIARRGRS